MSSEENGQWVRSRPDEKSEPYMAEKDVAAEARARRRDDASPAVAVLALLVIVAIAVVWTLM